MTDFRSNSLANTLVLALAQCQQQSRTACHRARRIEQLSAENEELKKELQAYKIKTHPDRLQDDSVLVQDLFQKHVEAQAEIQRLRRRLRAYKDRAGGGSSIPLSSPVATPATPVSSSPKRIFDVEAQPTSDGPSARPVRIQNDAKADQTLKHNASDGVLNSPPRKRVRVDSLELRNALAELPPNPKSSRVFSSASALGNGTAQKSAAGIWLLAEDGDEYSSQQGHADLGQRTITRDDSAYQRLDTLLAGSTPTKQPLTRPTSRSPQPQASTSKRVEEKNLDTSENSPYTSNMSVLSIETLSTTLLHPQYQAAKHETKPGSIDRQISAGEQGMKRGPLDKATLSSGNAKRLLRSRSPGSLTLACFKPNPRWLSSHNISYDDFLNDHQYERIHSLTTTLPHLPREPVGTHSSDYELLLEFLGPGSEDRIANMTTVARENLLLEAQTKRVAQYFKFSRNGTNPGKEDVPPGYWSTDMPGTQEADENREAGRQRDREEVHRRYNDAVAGNGKWIFADE